MDPNFFKLLLGAISIVFTLDYWSKHWRKRECEATKPNLLCASIAAVIAGFTSFVTNSGGPPTNMYLLPQKLQRILFVATTVLLFTVINYTKLIPYA